MKTISRSFLYILLPLALLYSITVANAVNIVTNPGFETGDFSGWTLSGTNSLTVNGAEPHSGQFAVQDNGRGDAFLSQTLTTTPGGSYTIDFWLRNSNSNNTGNDFNMSFGGVTLFSVVNQPLFGYTEFTFTGVAASSSTILRFGMSANNSFWWFDDVSVTATVPEQGPGTVGLIALGALVLVGAVRKRRSV
jgi:MYXO-CTERM domain-containing protein